MSTKLIQEQESHENGLNQTMPQRQHIRGGKMRKHHMIMNSFFATCIVSFL